MGTSFLILQTDLNIVDVVPVPGSTEKLVTKPEDEQVLNHLLSEIMVNAENLFLSPVRLKCFLEFPGALEILSKWLFNNQACNTFLGVAILLQMLGNGGENARRQCHVEDTVVFRSSFLEVIQVFPKPNERFVLVVLARYIRTLLQKFVKLFFHLLNRCLDVRLDPIEVLLPIHLRARISYNVAIFGEELVSVLFDLSMDCVLVRGLG